MILLFGLLFLLSLELTVRLFLALFYSRDLFFYGTRSCQTGVLPLWLYRDQGRTVFRVSRTLNGYCKYQPQEILVDRDWDGEPFLVSVNQAGYRGPSFAEKKEGVYRIALVGSGAVFGYATREESTLAASLTKCLGEKPEVEVINLGIPRMTSEKIACQLFREFDLVKPDLVIFYGGVEDTRDCLPSLWVPRCLELLRRVSAWTALMSSGVPRRSFSRSDFESQAERMGQRYLTELEKIRAMCRKRNVDLLMVPQQMRSLAIASKDLKDTSVTDEAKVVLEELDSDLVDSFRFRYLLHTRLMQYQRAWCLENSVARVSSEALRGRRDLILGHAHLAPEGYELLSREIESRVRDFCSSQSTHES